MKAKLTRHYNVITAEVYREVAFPGILGGKTEIILWHKRFNSFWGDLGFEPTEKTYIKAKKWLEDTVALHKKFTEPTVINSSKKVVYNGDLSLEDLNSL